MEGRLLMLVLRRLVHAAVSVGGVMDTRRARREKRERTVAEA